MLQAAFIVLLIALLPSHARAEARIALLIGNKDYKPGVGALTDPLNDARMVGEALKAIVFEVLKPVQNARRADMLIAIHAFEEKLRNAGSNAVGFLYYSGHGIITPAMASLLQRSPIGVTGRRRSQRMISRYRSSRASQNSVLILEYR